MFRFCCATCGEWHEGMPSFGAEAPLYYYTIPDNERAARCHLTSDICIVDEEFFFIRGCIEIPVNGAEEPFVWGVWVSLSHASFTEYAAHFDATERSHLGPYFGWLSATFLVYPDLQSLDVNIKTYVHPRNDGIRPYIELERTGHLLAIEQRNGITVDRLAEIYAAYQH